MVNRTRFVAVSGGLLSLIAASTSALAADNPAPVKQTKANYELAAEWTPAKMGKLVLESSVTPHWLDQGDRFWYTFENSKGRKFYIIDPVKKTRTFVFDPVKLSAQLTTATGMPYDSQHLPITTIRFVKNDTTIQFELIVPKDAVIPGEKKSNATQTQTEAGNGNGQDQDPQQQQGGRGGRGGPVANRNEKTLTFATKQLSLNIEDQTEIQQQCLPETISRPRKSDAVCSPFHWS